MERRKRSRLLLWLSVLTVLFLCASTPASAQTKELDRLNDNARRAARKNRMAEADSLYTAYLVRYDQLGLAKGFDYSENLGWLVRYAAQQGHIDSAIKMQQEVVSIRSTAPDCNYAQWAAAMSDLASLYSQKGDYTSAINTGQEAVDMMRRKFGEKHHYYCISLANLASYYGARGQTGDYQKAVQMSEAAVKHIKRGTPEYANALNALVVFYSQTGNRLQANKLSAKARKEARKRLEEDGVGYATTLNNQAIRLANTGNYDEAIAYALTAKDCFEQAGAQRTLSYSKLLSNLGTFYSHQQKYNEAAKMLEAALPVIEQAASKQHPDYVRCISDLSSVYKNIGDLDRADQLAHESEKVSETLGEQDNMKYARSLSKQAATFASNGNFTRAIEHERKALRLFTARHDTTAMAFSLGTLANYLFKNEQRNEALSTAEQALDLFRRRDEPSAYFAQSLNNAAILHFNNADYQQASDYGRQALRMYQQTGDTVNTIYARIKANNGLFLFMKDSVEQAMQVTRQAIDLNQRILGSDHPDNIPLLYNQAVYQMKSNLMAEAEASFTEALRLQAQTVRTNFQHLTSQEREKYWNQKKYVFRFAPLLAYQANRHSNLESPSSLLDSPSSLLPPPSSLLATEAYNALLFTKGILLNSDIDFRRLLRRSGDDQLLKKYNQIDMLRQSEEDYYRLPLESRDAADLRRIREEKYQLERELVRGCREYGSFTENLDVDAAQIARALKPDEAAIEFADVYIHGMGTTYMALVLTHDHPQPRLLRLFSEEDLKDLKYAGGQNFLQAMTTSTGVDQIYDDPRFGSLLWQPIVGSLPSGVRKLYFSPSAMFHQMGIEYLPCDTAQRIYDRYDVYRLSSTKLLAHRPQPKPLTTATVYGGLVYDMTLADLQRQHDNLSKEEGQSLLAMADFTGAEGHVSIQRTLDSLALRGAAKYLEYSATEAENIAEQLMQHHVNTRMLMKHEGTEETFKALSGNSTSLIHIATHGFAYGEQDRQKREELKAYLSEQADDRDDPLNFSGLLLSGANYALQGHALPPHLDDGVLTAREIAQVDLGKTDMVVLSACQTALGDIRDDGVFGLSRAFKKAGVNTLLMSLWQVDDKATNTMMTTFYEQLMQGRTPVEAFRAAQKAMRLDPETASPSHWASFILLDAF